MDTPRALARLGPKWAQCQDINQHSARRPEKGAPSVAGGRGFSRREPVGRRPWHGKYRDAEMREPHAIRKAACASACVAQAAAGLGGLEAAQGNYGLKTGMIGEIVEVITVMIVTCIQRLSHWSHIAPGFLWSLLAVAGHLATMALADDDRCGGVQTWCAGLKDVWPMRTIIERSRGIESIDSASHHALRPKTIWQNRTTSVQSRGVGSSISAWRDAPTPIKNWLTRKYVYKKHIEFRGRYP